MKLRPYKLTEYDEVERLLKDGNLFFEPFDSRDTINAKSIADPESIVVAIIKNQIVGCVFIVIDPWANTICHMTVDSKFQDKGIGSALLQHGEDLIKQRGRNNVVMYVMSENTDALRLYERKGYSLIPDITCVYKLL